MTNATGIESDPFAADSEEPDDERDVETTDHIACPCGFEAFGAVALYAFEKHACPQAPPRPWVSYVFAGDGVLALIMLSGLLATVLIAVFA